jgi:hypothetical protein
MPNNAILDRISLWYHFYLFSFPFFIFLFYRLSREFKLITDLMAMVVIHGIFHAIRHLVSFAHMELEPTANVRIRWEPIFVIVPILIIGMAQNAVLSYFF